MKEVFPKTETLKQQVLKKFHQDHKQFQEETVSISANVSGTSGEVLCICIVGKPKETGRFDQDPERVRGSSYETEKRSTSKRIIENCQAS